MKEVKEKRKKKKKIFGLKDFGEDSQRRYTADIWAAAKYNPPKCFQHPMYGDSLRVFQYIAELLDFKTFR